MKDAVVYTCKSADDLLYNANCSEENDQYYQKKHLKMTAKFPNRRRSRCCRFLIGATICLFTVLLVLFLTVTVVIPLVFKYCPVLLRSLIFPTWAIEPGKNYSAIEELVGPGGLDGVKNFYLHLGGPDNITLGAWLILPEHYILSNKTYDYDSVLSDRKERVLLYLHGNGVDRSDGYIKYRHLRKIFAIVAIDYRSYADSTAAEITVTSITTDVAAAYNWLVERRGDIGTSGLYVWGHSIGTGVATHTLAMLRGIVPPPDGLVLESPFSSAVDVLDRQPAASFLSWLGPWYKYTVLDSVKEFDFNFDNEKKLPDVDCPVLVLHAMDDRVIPYDLAQRLTETAKAARNSSVQGTLTFYLFSEEKHYSHLGIARDPALLPVIWSFIEECTAFRQKKTQLDRAILN